MRQFLSCALTAVLCFAGSGRVWGQSGTTGSSGSNQTGSSTTSTSFGSSSTSSGSSSSSSRITSGNSSTSRTSSTDTRPTTATGTDAFIGNNAASVFSGANRQAGAQQLGMSRQFAQFQSQTSNTSRTQQSTTGTPREVRTVIRLGFSFPTMSSTQVTRLAPANSTQLTRFAASRPELNGIDVSLTASGTAVLSGQVNSTETSRLAANLVRLQPGVRNVQNNLSVAAN